MMVSQCLVTPMVKKTTTTGGHRRGRGSLDLVSREVVDVKILDSRPGALFNC